MHMSSGVKHHLDNRHHENSSQRNGSRHGGVLLRPKAVETLVAERDESGRQKMDESRGNQDSSTKVADGKEEHGWETNHGKAGHQDRKSAGEEGDAEYDGKGGTVKGRVVKFLIGHATLGTS